MVKSNNGTWKVVGVVATVVVATATAVFSYSGVLRKTSANATAIKNCDDVFKTSMLAIKDTHREDVYDVKHQLRVILDEQIDQGKTIAALAAHFNIKVPK